MPCGAVVAGPRPGKIPPIRWRHPGGIAETLPIALRFRCETVSLVPLFHGHCPHALPPRARTNSLSSLPHIPVRLQGMCAFLPPYPLFPSALSRSTQYAPRPVRLPPYLLSLSASWSRSAMAAFGTLKHNALQFVCFPEPEAVLAIFEYVKRIRYQSDQTGNNFL